MNPSELNGLFERAITYPDIEIKERFDRLVGLDNKKQRFAKILSTLVNPEGLRTWANKHHNGSNNLLDYVLRRPPLVVLAGDVGSGKTELAETIGDAVARAEKIEITLLPLSLSTRGQGRVGEMTQLISAAFEHTISEASKLKASSGKNRGAIILHIDEADSLAQSRENSQMHHEDRAGVNALLRGIDQIANRKLPVAVVMCTNRLNALDPALKRRSADILTFGRPNEKQRLAVLQGPLSGLGFEDADILELVKVTGEQHDQSFGFTFSDLTQRLLPSLVLDAYPKNPISPLRALEVAKLIDPTPPFQEEKI